MKNAKYRSSNTKQYVTVNNSEIMIINDMTSKVTVYKYWW